MRLTPGEAALANRRAGALLLHHGQLNREGMDAVLDDVKTGVESKALLFALAGIFESLLPELRTPTGIALLREFVAGAAAAEEGHQS